MALFSWIKNALSNAEEEKTEDAKLQEFDTKQEEPVSLEEESAALPRPECPIYEYIKSHTQDGRLPEDFRIPWIGSPWAPGAQDGVFLYHMAPLSPDPDREQKILQALKMMSSEDNGDHIQEVFQIFEKIEKDTSIVRLFDEIIRIILANQADLNFGNLLNFGDWLICNGVSLLSVKLGLTVIAPFSAPFVEEVRVFCSLGG